MMYLKLENKLHYLAAETVLVYRCTGEKVYWRWQKFARCWPKLPNNLLQNFSLINFPKFCFPTLHIAYFFDYISLRRASLSLFARFLLKQNFPDFLMPDLKEKESKI